MIATSRVLMAKVRIACFAGSTLGTDPEFHHQCVALGKELASRSISLIVAGLCNGLQKSLAQSVQENGGEVIHVVR